MLNVGHRKLDIVLDPGQFHFGGGDLRIGTLLGSCVAITMWHPSTRYGGMCHYLLPTRGQDERPATEPLDGRYADEAVDLFLTEIARVATSPEDYQIKIFGGGDQFPRQNRHDHPIDVPTRNIDAGQRLLAEHGLAVTAQHIGGSGPRQVVLDLADGNVWVRHRRILRMEAP